ncbi:MAG: Exo-beta-D-glucosaminidase [Bacteroidota bacterium]
MRQNYYFLVVLFLIIQLHSQAEKLNVFELSTGWEFRRVGETAWMPAAVPGSVHLDLVKNNKIPDPFFSDNESRVQWVDTCDWEYRCRFSAPSGWSKSKATTITFDGLDTYAKVYINDSLLLSADNMFRQWSIDLGGLLRDKNNELKVVFTSAKREMSKRATLYPVKIPGGDRVFARKAAFQSGWDFGPTFLGCGIWKPVRLSLKKKAAIVSVQMSQIELSDEIAVLEINTTVDVKMPGVYSLVVENKTSNEKTEKAVQLVAGINTIKQKFEIQNPQRWWTYALGTPFCYDFVVTMSDETSFEEKQKVVIGLRELELVQEADSIGTSFYFKLNGVPVFMKGANVVPLDHFLTRVDSTAIDKLLNDAKTCNMNIVRIWGGGVYPDDYFYDRCDRLGMLVWQDFMSACSMIPGDSSFVANFQEEVVQQVQRLRNHPSLALWCGNNENEEGWYNWGWQKELNYSPEDSATVWKYHTGIFREMIPNTLADLDPSRPYWPSSPSIGWGRPESLLSGDSHYWGVWWGKQPFDIYNQKVGRFMSEYGFQGLPPMATWEQNAGTTKLDITMPAVKNHQKHPTGFETIQSYLQDAYNRPKDFTSYIYVTQLLQVNGIQTAIEAHRRNKPRCMGTLYWQFNDTWPGISWSGRDYYGRWKALQYTVRDCYQTLMISVVEDRHKVDVYVSSDSLADYLARMEIRLVDLKGNVRWAEVVAADIKANTSSLVCSRDLSRLVQGVDTSNLFLNVRIIYQNETLAEKTIFFCQPKNLKLMRPSITIRALPAANGFKRLEIKTSAFAKNMELSYKGDPSIFDRNYIDMIPGQAYEIKIRDTEFPSDGITEIKYRSLIDTY